jgi:pimeloyl-ACP methyl ester carboxylesterase
MSVNMPEITSRREVESILSEKIPSKKVRGFIMKNLQRTSDNSFRWKINALTLINNLENILGGIDRNNIFRQQVTGFPVIFLKGADSDYLPPEDFSDIKQIFPAAEFITVPGAGHWIHSDRPEEVIMSIKKLLSDS